MQNLSKLHIWSLGTVAVNKPLNQHFIEVAPSEIDRMADGEITDDTAQYAVSGTDGQGGAYQDSVPMTKTIRAEWLPVGHSNRFSSPDVRRGETVAIYRFADVDKYYWTTLFNDMKLRKLETVIYGIVATSDENATAGADNTYFFEMSSHTGTITLHTSKANGEFCIYDLQINAKQGYITIQDDLGNYFSFNSRERQIEVRNYDGTHLDINKTNFTLTVPDTYTVNAAKVRINASDSIEERAPTTLFETKHTIKGQATVRGPFKVMSFDGSGPGVAEIDGDFKLTGRMRGDAEIEADQLISIRNVIAPNINSGN